EKLKRKSETFLPELAEIDVIRHFTALSRNNFGVDNNFYPLGSCTMKYNPKLGEIVARDKRFSNLHPILPQLPEGNLLTQGALQIIYETGRLLSEITGMDEFTTQPLAGAHGELTGMMIVSAYHRKKGNKKTRVIIPDSAHGTNPASAAICGYDITSIPTDKNGVMDIKHFKKELDEEVAAVMLTCPNTLGIFNSKIGEICKMAHSVDALMYYDGANLNAILGKCRPGDIGFDLVHLNLHKTFATPHGGGGPGAGPVGVKEKLRKFLPISRVVKDSKGAYFLDYNEPSSIGYLAPFYGNFGVILKAYIYILTLGKEGLIKVAENAVLNANYLLAKLKNYYHLPYNRTCMHEFVLSANKQKEKGVRALDIAKRLLDFGFHPPTIYFPLIVEEAMMIEPTETESKETLDKFMEAMIKIAKEAEENPDTVKNAPHNLPISRLDEVKAARELKLRFPAS
ncbi:MAG: glycine dehydrogenase (aminomethyl-transferring), partial [bacterium (Candidatus Ratteibacteria) CG_4_9_14_3_um_filter_41_21]